MKRRLSDSHDSPNSLPSTKCRRIQRAAVLGASPPPSNPSSQTLAADAPSPTAVAAAAAQDEEILHWLYSCDASPEPVETASAPHVIETTSALHVIETTSTLHAFETMSAPPIPRSAASNLDNGSRRAARRSARARSHSSRTPSPSKKPTLQSYRRGNMRYANVLVDALGQLPPAIDNEARRVLGLQSWAQLAQPDTHAQTPPDMQARLAELAAPYRADSLLNARECALEGNWKSSLFTLLRNIALLAPDTLCLHMSEKAWIPGLKPAAPPLDGLQEAGDEPASTLVDSQSPAMAVTTAPSFPGRVPSLPPSTYSSAYSQSITTTTSLNASDPFHISTPKPDITVGLEETTFSLLHQRRLVDHQQSGTILSDPHAAFMGMRFPFLVVETKGLSVNGNLVSAQNQAAISGACMLRILEDLDETTNLQSTPPPLCFSIVTEGPTHEVWIHFKHEDTFHMEALKSWRTTHASDVGALVRALVNIMEWGRGAFRDGIVARLDNQPAVMSGEYSER